MTQTLTTDELRQIVETDHVQCGDAAAMARELLANREAQPVAVTDEMALAFHRALNDGGIGESDLEEIKVGLRGALCNITAPPAPVVNPEFTGATAVPDFKKLARELVENLVDCGGVDNSSIKQYLKWTEKTCRAAMLAAAPEGGNEK